jgi:regulator of replication initiation timing
MSYIKDESRKNWTHDESKKVTFEEINTGALMRIADAVEKMAERYTELIHDKEFLEVRVKRLHERNEFLERSNASLRGHLRSAKKVKPEVSEITIGKEN